MGVIDLNKANHWDYPMFYRQNKALSGDEAIAYSRDSAIKRPGTYTSLMKEWPSDCNLIEVSAQKWKELKDEWEKEYGAKQKRSVAKG